MKLDITKLPVLEAIVGFLMVALVGTFVLAFTVVDSSRPEKELVEPTPDGSPTAAPSGDGGGEIAIAMLDNSFDPDETTVAAGDTVVFALTNEGAAPHNMRIAGPDGDYETGDDAVSDPELLSAGDEGAVTWDAPSEAGEIDFRCDFHPTEMTGTITVE